MKNFLEELRVQRDHIRRHLEWIERKIELLESEDARPDGINPSTDTRTNQASADNNFSPGPGKARELAGEKATERPPDTDPAVFQESHGQSVLRAKRGCLLLFLLGILLFLFLLFGLPYLVG